MSATKRAEARAFFEHLYLLRNLYRWRGEQDATSACSITEALQLADQAFAASSSPPAVPCGSRLGAATGR